MNFHLFNEDFLKGVDRLKENSIDLVIADPPYSLGKDYGNDSDKKSPKDFLNWTKEWITAVEPKIKETGSLYIFTTWRFAPEIFSFMKTKFLMINEIIWDRKVPSMGGSTRRFSSVHDTIGFFAKSKDYYFDIDSVRVPYDPDTKKARTRSIFVGKKWLEMGYNPKDVWSVSRLHKIHRERENHPTQKPLKIIERIVKASSPENGVVLDPFAGSGTSLVACLLNNRQCLAYEINPEYCSIIKKRLQRIKKQEKLNLEISFV